MSNNRVLRLDLRDVYGDPISERVDVMLRHQTLSDRRIVRSTKATKTMEIRGLSMGLHRLEVDPPSYLPVARYVDVKSGPSTDIVIVFPIDPKKVSGVVFPGYGDLPARVRKILDDSREVFSFPNLSGEDLYAAGTLGDLRRAGFLNVVQKASASPLSNGRTVLDYILEVKELRGDRFFAVVPRELREETKNSVADGLFTSVSGTMHHLPSDFRGFTDAGSFKTPDDYGNLQLTFFMRGDDCVADIDIDDAAGIGHVFQVLRNALTKRPTHPYDIHEILIRHQFLDPGYRFLI